MITVWHAVTQRPMILGQEIVFDEAHPSGVYSRVMEKMPQVEAILADPEAYRGVKLEHHTAVALRELAMEEVRREKYPQYPSRMHCLYVTGTFEEAKNWAEYFRSLGRRVYQVVRLSVEGNVFEGDASRCFTGSPDWQENLRLAEEYWRNERRTEDPEPIREMLADGCIRVEEIVLEYPEEDR